MFGLSIAGYMYVTYGTFFYTETIGLSMKLIALGNVLYAVWDAFNDPIAGYLSDRTRTRWGRRKPWLLVSVPVFVLSSILFFSPPASLGTGVGLAVYFTVFLMLTETGNTISTVNYHSLLPELYRDEKRRNQANALRQAMQLVGMIIGVSLVPMITAAIGYRATALALGLLSGALILLLPALVAPNALWLAMPVTEAVVATAVAVLMARYTRALGTSAAKACEKPA